MDFSFSEDQGAIRDLAKQILSDQATETRLNQLKAEGEGFDKNLWYQFAESGLLGMAIPESSGGSGFGLTELCLMLEEQGRHVAPMPLLPSLVLTALPIARFGTKEQQERYLQPLACGEHILTAALAEQSMPEAIRSEATVSTNGDSLLLNGTRECVPYAGEARAILMPATDDSGKTVLLLVDALAAGVELTPQNSTHGEPLYTVQMADVAVRPQDVLVGAESGEEALEWIIARGQVAAAATMVGVTEEALRRTAEYTTERKQFGKAIAGFQSTTMRCADAYIDIEAMRSTYWQALWQLEEEKAAAPAVATAKWWACIGGGRVVHTAQHLHGGIGADIDYPLHRYFLWAKQLELSLGGGTYQQATLGALLADESAEVNVL
ncbi:acyl-CoA dehydrogenase family protein [Endozoicomonas sp.]|uniref:acyl-CoA dehydrogenase family protein n=1 Tax=Endozoicomonas sp. TaxID=1892382 RepID=UPI003AF56E86